MASISVIILPGEFRVRFYEAFTARNEGTERKVFLWVRDGAEMSLKIWKSRRTVKLNKHQDRVADSVSILSEVEMESRKRVAEECQS
jgi:hypothetical protein